MAASDGVRTAQRISGKKLAKKIVILLALVAASFLVQVFWVPIGALGWRSYRGDHLDFGRFMTGVPRAYLPLHKKSDSVVLLRYNYHPIGGQSRIVFVTAKPADLDKQKLKSGLLRDEGATRVARERTIESGIGPMDCTEYAKVRRVYGAWCVGPFGEIAANYEGPSFGLSEYYEVVRSVSAAPSAKE